MVRFARKNRLAQLNCLCVWFGREHTSKILFVYMTLSCVKTLTRTIYILMQQNINRINYSNFFHIFRYFFNLIFYFYFFFIFYFLFIYFLFFGCFFLCFISIKCLLDIVLFAFFFSIFYLFDELSFRCFVFQCFCLLFK